MKKAILPMFLMVFAVSCLLALESDPSATVGFVKYTVKEGYSRFALPFTFYNLNGSSLTETMTYDDIVGAQLTGGTASTGDQIINLVTGQVSYLGSDGVWSGSATSFIDNTPYAFYHRTDTTINVYLAGTVEHQAQTVGTFNPGYSLVALREAGSVVPANMDLNPGTVTGFTGGTSIGASDQLIDTTNGNFCWYNTNTSAWAGTINVFKPGYPMCLYVAPTHHAVTWMYDPSTRSVDDSNPTTMESEK